MRKSSTSASWTTTSGTSNCYRNPGWYQRRWTEYSEWKIYCCRQNLKFGNFTLSSDRPRQRIVLKCVPHVQHDYFSSFNQSDHCFLASSLPLPSSLLKLPDAATHSANEWRHIINDNSIGPPSFSPEIENCWPEDVALAPCKICRRSEPIEKQRNGCNDWKRTVDLPVWDVLSIEKWNGLEVENSSPEAFTIRFASHIYVKM